MFPEYDPRDRRFSGYLNGNCQLEKLYSGTLWAEGPVYFCDGGFLLWSDIHNDRMLKWTPGGGVTEFRRPSNYANGHTRDRTDEHTSDIQSLIRHPNSDFCLTHKN